MTDIKICDLDVKGPCILLLYIHPPEQDMLCKMKHISIRPIIKASELGKGTSGPFTDPFGGIRIRISTNLPEKGQLRTFDCPQDIVVRRGSDSYCLKRFLFLKYVLSVKYFAQTFHVCNYVNNVSNERFCLKF